MHAKFPDEDIDIPDAAHRHNFKETCQEGQGYNNLNIYAPPRCHATYRGPKKVPLILPRPDDRILRDAS